jgi:hypothetical protein
MRLSNLPPGCTLRDIERAACGDDEDRDEAYGRAMAALDLPEEPDEGADQPDAPEVT